MGLSECARTLNNFAQGSGLARSRTGVIFTVFLFSFCRTSLVNRKLIDFQERNHVYLVEYTSRRAKRIPFVFSLLSRVQEQDPAVGLSTARNSFPGFLHFSCASEWNVLLCELTLAKRRNERKGGKKDQGSLKAKFLT